MTAVIILIAATLLALYILAGYPLLLAAIRWRRLPPPAKDLQFTPLVSVIIAVHNGEKFIREKLNCVLALDYPREKLDVLIVSDGSTDATESIAQEYEKFGVRLLRVPRGGKAAALSAALDHVSAEILFFTDVRQTLDPQALRHLAANFADPTVGGVTGELAYYDDAGSGQQATLDVYWRYELFARRKHTEIDSTFAVTGAIWAARRALVHPLEPDTLTDDAILPLRIFFAGYRVIADPAAVAWDHRAHSPAEFKRRLRTLAGLWQVHLRLPRLFTGANRMRLHFLSHKFGRLLLPWAIVAIYASTAALPESRWKSILLLNEVVFVGLALVAPFIPQRFPLRRVFSAVSAFCTMNLAAFAAAAIFVRPASKFWPAPTTEVRPLPETPGESGRLASR